LKTLQDFRSFLHHYHGKSDYKVQSDKLSSLFAGKMTGTGLLAGRKK
jgi:hypothetical protein